MKKCTFQRLGAAALTVLAMAAHAGQLDNGDFETGLSGWVTEGSVSATSTDVHGGSVAALLDGDSASLTAVLSDAVDVSTITSFGFWARSDAGLLSLVVLSYSDGTTSGTDVSIFDLGNSAWTYHDLSASLAAGKSLTGFTLYGSSAATSLIDDVTLTTAVPEPTSFTLLAAGLLAFSRVRRPRA